jgi:hypothetical protein
MTYNEVDEGKWRRNLSRVWLDRVIIVYSSDLTTLGFYISQYLCPSSLGFEG